MGLLAGLFIALGGHPAQAGTSCEDAGAEAERSHGLPPGLLQAIGQVESGRWDNTERRVVAWPWSVDIDGEPRRYDTADAAVRDLRAQGTDGRHSIDVGCFQINLSWHPGAFASLEEAFDPVANANYAASFLRSLSQRLGSWPAAIAAYHSANPDLGLPYRDRVMALWSTPALPVPVWQSEAERFGMHIWTPATVGVPNSVSHDPSEPANPALPRIITPAQ